MDKNAHQCPKHYHIPDEVPHCTHSMPGGYGKHTPPRTSASPTTLLDFQWLKAQDEGN